MALTDWHTDVLATIAATGGVQVVVNHLSRLIVDPERFPDPFEPMEAVGMGAVYHRSSDGRPLRSPDPARDERLLNDWFHPYAQAVADEVDHILAASGRCLIVDLHSYPTLPLPYEADPTAPRPGVCLGTDTDHTPPELVALAREVFAGVPGGVGKDTPFAGTYVPLRHHRTDPRVTSIMIEIRRDLYLEPPRTYLDEAGHDLSRRISELIERWTATAPPASAEVEAPRDWWRV